MKPENKEVVRVLTDNIAVGLRTVTSSVNVATKEDIDKLKSEVIRTARSISFETSEQMKEFELEITTQNKFICE